MQLNINEFTYPLPAGRIAAYPLDHRDQSRLLVYDSGEIMHKHFHSIADYLPANGLLFFNDTKVIPARLHFQKWNGTEIEILLLNPLLPSGLVLDAMQTGHACTWKCIIGNLKRWKDGKPIIRNFHGIALEATLQNREEGRVEFKWDTGHTFAEVLQLTGETPLPPYIRRKAEVSDRERYQTIYSQYEGAVAAPTAGLHFTTGVFDSLQKKKIQTDFVTLHVGAGTFQPIKVENAAAHSMHNEQVVVSRKNIENLLQDRFIVSVGTTSLRTLESLYWYGVKLLKDPDATFSITQQYPYQVHGALPSRGEALTAIAAYMNNHGKNTVTGETSIYILPGYTFQICQALITNFHQPGSTLIVLVAAFIGKDWKKVYDEALQHNYRFLSYGDSSLLIPLAKK